ncbi:MAG: DUF1292 domain-containing protein [Clostridia bacterium]|nr:DUF1292 domain-containing protein [Clostridia bacterium]
MTDERTYVTLVDNDGDELDFELVDVVPYDGAEYAVLLPYNEEDGEAVILLLVPSSGNDDDMDDEELKGIDDPELLEAVYQEFLKRQSDEGDI